MPTFEISLHISTLYSTVDNEWLKSHFKYAKIRYDVIHVHIFLQ